MVLLLLFNGIATIAPACSFDNDGNPAAYSLVVQHTQAVDMMEETPPSSACVLSRFKATSRPLQPELAMTRCIPPENTMQVYYTIAPSNSLQKPDYYRFIFRYSLF